MFLCLLCDRLKCLPAITELMVYCATAGDMYVESMKQQWAENPFNHLVYDHNNIVRSILSQYTIMDIGRP